MCGQAGLILGRRRRSASERADAVAAFVHLMLLSEVRGPHATGIARLQRQAPPVLRKAPLPAADWLDSDTCNELLAGVDAHTTALLGHTRWRTRGDPGNNANNHPIRAGDIVGTHNGTLYNADALFRRLRLPRFAEVDSEVIFRMAQRCTLEGKIDVPQLAVALSRCRGQMSAALVSRIDPERIVLIKGNKPLELWYHPRRKLAVYASDGRFLEDTLGDESGWQPHALEPMTITTWDINDLTTPTGHPLEFRTQERRGTLPAGVAA